MELEKEMTIRTSKPGELGDVIITHYRRTGMMSRLLKTLVEELKKRPSVDLCFLKEDAIDKHFNQIQQFADYEITYTKLYSTRSKWIWSEIDYEAVPVDFVTEKLFMGIRLTKKNGKSK